MLGPANPFKTVAGRDPDRRPGPEPAAAEPHPHGVPPADALPRLRRLHRAVRLRDRRADHRPGRRGLAARDPPLDALRVGLPHVGIVLGAWWSYEVLGWGGYWAWDPVENASFLPWLTGTAYLHSVMVQERRGMLRVWNLSLLCATFSLTILGTFLTRSGVLDSVHAFTRERRSAPCLLTFFAHRRASDRSGSSGGAATGCGRPARSTRRSRVRARSSPTTCCSRRSRSSCCSAPSSR